MHIVTVDNFLCCFKLETGGYFIGWLGTIFTSIGIVALAALGVFVSVNYEAVHEALTNGTLVADTQFDNWALDQVLDATPVVLMIVLIVVVAIMLVYLFAFIMLIVGTKNRNSSRVVPYLILEAISIICGFSQLVPLNWQNVVTVVVNTIVNGYLYICIYSLYVKLRQEKKYKFPEV